MRSFIINDSIRVEPEKNLIGMHKVEPRYMKLLVLLVAQPGQVVSREEITEKIWNGYGGSEEGMTQAISFLRKALGDGEKKLIETIPKAGYCFNGSVAWEEDLEEGKTNHPPPAANKRSLLQIILIALILVSLFLLLIPLRKSNAPVSPKAPVDAVPNNPPPSLAPKAPAAILLIPALLRK